MERRKILLGSGALFATALAGCTSGNSDQKAGADDHTGSNTQDGDRDDKKDSAKDEDNKESNPGDGDEKKEPDYEDGKTEQQNIPGFDRDEFDIDSNIIEVKKIIYRNHKFDIQVMVTTTDQDVLAEELRALGPGFERAMRSADVDTEEFFAEVKQIKFTLYDEHKNTVFAIFLDLRWLREYLDGKMTNEEIADRMLEQVDQE